MYSVRSRALQCLRPHIRSFSEATVPRPAVVEGPEKSGARVASNLNGISIPHKDEIGQRQQTFSYRPNISYLKAKPGLAAQLAMRNSNISKTSSILGKEQSSSSRPPKLRGKAGEGQAPRTRPQVNVGPRTERPRPENGRPSWPPRERKINFQDKNGHLSNKSNSFRPNAGAGPRHAGFTPRALPPRAPQSPPSDRQRFTPRQASPNSSSKNQAARRGRGNRGAQKGEETEGSEVLPILDQCPPEVALTPDFTPSDLKNLPVSSPEEAQRPRSVFEHIGGDYSRYVPQISPTPQDSKLATIGTAEAALVRRREVGLAQKSQLVDVVKRSVGLKDARAKA